MSQSAHAAIAECHALGGLDNGHVVFTILEAEKCKIKMAAN